jgi:hypothetical protein
VTRCTPTEALNILRRAFSPPAAARRLTDVIQDNEPETFRLWCDGKLVKPHMRAIAKVMPWLDEEEGRWTADIESTGAGLPWARGLPWEFDVDDVVALLPARPGRKGVNWEVHATLELERLGRKAALDLHNSGQLRPHLEGFLKREIKFVPKDDKAFTAVITAFLHPPN